MLKQYNVVALLSIQLLLSGSLSEVRAQDKGAVKQNFRPMQFVTSPIKTTKTTAKYVHEKVREFVHPIRDLSPTITGLEKPIKELSKPIRDLSQPIRELQTPVNNLSKPIDRLHSPITNLEQPLKGLQVPLNNVETSVKQIQQPISEVGGSLNKLSPNLKGLEQSTGNLNAPLVDLHKSTSRLSNPIDKLTVGIDALGEDLQEVGQIRLVNEPILELEGQVNSLAASVNRLCDAIYSLIVGAGVFVTIAFSYAVFSARRNALFNQRIVDSYRYNELQKAEREKELVS